ncbi:MAG TPA: Ig-like domain-containing protein [Pseudomonadales bacterium]|nr:Ig-like domain-containing protein [Pseudomonadales bacterium]
MANRLLTPMSLAVALATTPFSVAQELPPQANFGMGQPASLNQLPASELRETLSRLPAPAQAQALRWLQDIDFPAADVVHMRVDPDGGVFYVDHAGAELLDPPASVDNLSVAATDPGEVFFLHSRPGAANVVYLDFDGHTLSGTAWNNYTGAPSLSAKAFDVDGDPTTFNQEELSRIAETWHRIAEDFAAYDIDVTTEEPTTFGPRVGRLLFTADIDNNGLQMPAYGAGGVAYVGVWGRSDYATLYSPALVYYNRLGGGYAPYMAAAGSHELGHNLSLSHDGTNTVGYYDGHGSGYSSWGPIMGSGYYAQVTQWSNGNYNNANNTQDDIAILTGHLMLRSDDHGDNLSDASMLQFDANGDVSVSNPQVDAHNAHSGNKGVIETRTDVDVFQFNAGNGVVTLNVQPAWQAFYNNSRRGANLDVKLRLLDLAGNTLVSNEPNDETQATVSASVTEGSYYLEVSGVGNPTISYDDYGSQGMYFISGRLPVSSAPANRDPVAVDDSLQLDEDGASMIAVLSNDNDPDDDNLSISAVGSAVNGSVSLVGDNILYTPNRHFFGNDNFSYSVSDGRGGSAMANVNVTINSINDAPVAVSDSASTDAGTSVTIAVLNNDSDIDGDTLHIVLATTASNGTVSIMGNMLSYTPNAGFVGNDSFDYQISDGNLLATATVTVAVQSIALTSPSSFTITLSSDSATAQLHWQAVEGAQNYEIERSSLHKSGSRYVSPTLLSTASSNIDDTAGKGTYSYRVRAVRGTEVGPWSTSLEGISLLDSTGDTTSGGGSKGGRGKK